MSNPISISILNKQEIEAHDTLITLARRLARLEPHSLDRVFDRWDMLHMVEGPEHDQFRAWLKRVNEDF